LITNTWSQTLNVGGGINATGYYTNTDTSATLAGLRLKEAKLNNPSTSGYVLSSTTAGVRSWVNPFASLSSGFLKWNSGTNSFVAWPSYNSTGIYYGSTNPVNNIADRYNFDVDFHAAYLQGGVSTFTIYPGVTGISGGAGGVLGHDYAGGAGVKGISTSGTGGDFNSTSGTGLVVNIDETTLSGSNAVEINNNNNNNANELIIDHNLQFTVPELTGSLTDNTPTSAEIIAIVTADGMTAPSAGYQATIKDSDGTGGLYKVEFDGTDWYYVKMTKAL
jgi:hypothetical protein